MELLSRVQLPHASHVKRGLASLDEAWPQSADVPRLTRPNHMETTKYYVYILFSQKDKKFYVGSTGDLKKRFSSHKSGEVISTRNRRPLIIIHYEYFISKKDALAREKYLKSGYGHEQLESMLKNTLVNLRQT